MMMRVNAVSTSSIDGIRVIAVISSRVCSGRLTFWPPILPTLTSGRAGTAGAPGAAIARAGRAHSNNSNSNGR